ncbi:MAG TPA: leucyl aminopeptidase [Acetobacteraceae bacterium]|nr:leucyl aminopeptidase [Acetobacteraceae bacterium]
MLDITFAKSALPTTGALVLLATEEGGPGEIAEAADAATGGAIARALAAAEFKPKSGQTCTILAPAGGLSRVVVIGIGKLAELSPRTAEEAGGHAVTALGKDDHATIAAAGLPPALAASVALGAVMRSYRFDKYRTQEKAEEKPKLAKLTVLVSDVDAARAAWKPLRGLAEGVFVARDLVSEPPNVLDPVTFAGRIEELEKLGLKVTVLDRGDMKKLGFGALLGVAQGSENEPRTVVMEWRGAGGDKKDRAAPLAFIGKGVTFDTGGISIKPAGGMEDMKWDMAGAGAVVGLMAALASRKAAVDAVGLVGLVENMPGGNAQRPGDVVKTYSGQTVEVINTDAEGRLVLADVLWYCQEKYQPRFMIDLATLTGAMIISLGHEYAGFFSNDDDLSGKLFAAGEKTGEKVWRLPLGDAYDKLIKSDIADMKNVGGRPAGAISAAQFIQRFVNKKVWAHLDIAGMAWATKDSAVTPKGATAFGVRLLDRMIAEFFEGAHAG